MNEIWRKASRCDSAGCVEVADLIDGSRAVRDSKNPAQPALVFTAQEWRTFVAAVKAGEFDA